MMQKPKNKYKLESKEVENEEDGPLYSHLLLL